MKVPLLDLQAQYQAIKNEVRLAVDRVMESQQFILGPEVEVCEKKVAEYSQSAWACGVSSGTDALLLCLMNEDIGPGDEVITSPFTFFATAGSIVRTGARPVFADIDPETFNLDPDAVKSKITSKTRAVIPVHLYGQTADMGPLMALAAKHRLVVIEDAAQAIGSEYQGRRAGSIGHYGCFSFFPSKNLGAFGDGGMIVTPDEARVRGLKILRNHGADPKYYHKRVGGNFRLDALQAAVLNVKINYLDAWAEKRRQNAALYGRIFESAGLVKTGSVMPPRVVRERHVFNQYVIRAGRRDELKKFLESREIGCEIYYPLPLHLQACFRDLGYKPGDFPQSEKAARETLAIPVYPELGRAQVEYVAGCIAEFYRGPG